MDRKKQQRWQNARSACIGCVVTFGFMTTLCGMTVADGKKVLHDVLSGKHILTLSGRSSRTEIAWIYWFQLAVSAIGSTALALASGVRPVSVPLALTAGVATFGVAAAQFTATVRRVHDTGRTGWWLLVPIYGTPFLTFFTKGDVGNNRFGAPTSL